MHDETSATALTRAVVGTYRESGPAPLLVLFRPGHKLKGRPHMPSTADPSRPQDTQPALREEHYRPRDRHNVMSTRADLAGLLEKIAGELREAPEPTDAGPTTSALVEDTQETLAHAEALLTAVDRKLVGMTRAARTAYARQAGARRRVLDTEPVVTIDTLRELYVDKVLSCKEIGAGLGKSAQDIADVLTGAGIPLRRGRGKAAAATRSAAAQQEPTGTG
jgi:hypothetical protein